MSTPTEIETLTERYQQSSLFDRNIVRLVALNLYAMRQKDILKGLKAISKKSAKIKNLISPDALRKSIKKLIKSGLILKSTAGYSCPVDLRPTIIIDLIENKRLGKTGTALQEILPAFHTTSYSKIHKEIYYRSVRDFGITIFKKDYLAETYDKYIKIYIIEDYGHPLDIIFTQPFSPPLLNILDRNTVLFYLSP